MRRRARSTYALPRSINFRYTHAIMNKGKNQPPPVDNSVSDSTGQYDLRFVLWRQFCARYNIPVDTLPSQLDDEQKERWEEMKNERLKS